MRVAIEFMNRNKEIFKNIVGGGTFLIGSVSLYHLIRGEDYTKYAGKGENLKDKVSRVILGCAQTSFILSAAVSPVGVIVISAVVNQFFSSARLASVFGPNATFAENCAHPRHVFSLIAVGFAIPVVVKRLLVSAKKEENIVAICALFTIITSRPALHIGNQLARRFFK